MRLFFSVTLFISLLATNSLEAQSDTTKMISPEMLVQQQLDGYNARDIEVFLQPYSEDIELYDFPDKLSGKGKENMRINYQSFFESVPDLHCELVNRMILGNTVIDQERVTGFKNGYILEAIAIYKIVDNKIAKVFFIRKD